jgi:hypothetical protein
MVEALRWFRARSEAVVLIGAVHPLGATDEAAGPRIGPEEEEERQ